MVDFTLTPVDINKLTKATKTLVVRLRHQQELTCVPNLSSKPSVTRDTSRSNYNLHTAGLQCFCHFQWCFRRNWKLFLVNRITLLLENKSTRANNAGVRDITINLIKLFWQHFPSACCGFTFVRGQKQTKCLAITISVLNMNITVFGKSNQWKFTSACGIYVAYTFNARWKRLFQCQQSYSEI